MKNNSISLFFFYSKTTIKSWFQYRVDALMRSLAVFFRESTAIIVIYFTLCSFHSINGWNTKELFFLYSLLFLSYGILIIFFTGLRDFDNIILNGDFDRFLLRPRGVLFQVIACNADWFAAVGHGILGVVLFVVSANSIGIVWNTKNVLYYLFALLGGILIQGAIFLFLACLSFFFIKTGNIKMLCYWNMKKFAGYPISIYPKAIQYLLMYIVPFAFVNYFPSQYLLRKGDIGAYPTFYIYIAPIVGVILFLLTYIFWRFSIKFYKSTGN